MFWRRSVSGEVQFFKKLRKLSFGLLLFQPPQCSTFFPTQSKISMKATRCLIGKNLASLCLNLWYPSAFFSYLFWSRLNLKILSKWNVIEKFYFRLLSISKSWVVHRKNGKVSSKIHEVRRRQKERLISIIQRIIPAVINVWVFWVLFFQKLLKLHPMPPSF